jgi:hypothetical protein
MPQGIVSFPNTPEQINKLLIQPMQVPPGYKVVRIGELKGFQDRIVVWIEGDDIGNDLPELRVHELPNGCYVKRYSD